MKPSLRVYLSKKTIESPEFKDLIKRDAYCEVVVKESYVQFLDESIDINIVQCLSASLIKFLDENKSKSTLKMSVKNMDLPFHLRGLDKFFIARQWADITKFKHNDETVIIVSTKFSLHDITDAVRIISPQFFPKSYSFWRCIIKWLFFRK